MTIDTLRALCLSLPGATEDIKWEKDLCFCVGGRMFAVCGLDATPLTVSFKAADERFEEFTARPGIVPAPYLARHKWVLVEEAERLSPEEWESSVRQSYELVRAKLPAGVRKVVEKGNL